MPATHEPEKPPLRASCARLDKLKRDLQNSASCPLKKPNKNCRKCSEREPLPNRILFAKQNLLRKRPPLNSLLQNLTQSFESILQGQLFPILREELGLLSERHQQFARVLSLLQMDGHVSKRRGRGRPASDRAMMARAFVAKAVFNFPLTRNLLDRLRADPVLRRMCGFETVARIPAEWTFSRAFAEFAKSQFPQRVHAALIERTQAERLVCHISRDSTAIEAREKVQPKAAESKPVRKSRSKKKVTDSKKMTRLQRQASGTMTVEQMLAELPCGCDVGTKTNSKGRKSSWVGYKFHGDVADGHILISCALTAASVNDTQVAIPLAEMTARKVKSLYDLMDMGYVSSEIREHSVGLGHVPLIPRRKNEAPEPMEPHQQVRFRERTSVERVFSRLKDEFGGRYVRVRGAAKVMAHLMFGVLAMTADQIIRWITPPETESVPNTQ